MGGQVVGMVDNMSGIGMLARSLPISGSTYLVFQNSVERRSAPPEHVKDLEIVGPRTVIESVHTALRLHYPERQFPIKSRVITGDREELRLPGEVRLMFADCDHTAECLAVRVEFSKSEKVVVYTADGLFHSAILKLAQGADLLIGEAFGTTSDYEKIFRTVKHSLGIHLGELARSAGVKSVLPFHMHPRYGSSPEKQEEIIAEIRSSFDGTIHWPGDLTTIAI